MIILKTVAFLSINSYNEDLKNKIVALVDLLGGFKKFISPGDRVLLKPNFVIARPPESAVNTHPEFIAAIAELLLDYRCHVAIGDSPGLGNARTVAQKLGLIERLKGTDIKFINFTSRYLVPLDNDHLDNRKFRKLYLAGELLNYDKIINLPKLKTHAQMGITLATKNLFGCVVGKEKGQWHFTAGRDLRAFARLIVEIAYTANASLHILDGIIGMDGNGPTNGRPRQLGIALASTDPVSLDRVAIEILKKRPSRFPIFQEAKELGVFKGINNIRIKGDNPDDLTIKDFRIPALHSTKFVVNKHVSKLIEKIISQKLVLNHDLCTSCRRCEKHCPAGAISYNDKISINHDFCIRCCCCQELCPEGALSVNEPLILKLLNKLGIV